MKPMPPGSRNALAARRAASAALAVVMLVLSAARAQDAAEAEPADEEEEAGFFATYFDLKYWDDWYIGLTGVVSRQPYVGSDLRVWGFPSPTRLRDYTFTRQRFAFREGVGLFRFLQLSRFELALLGRFDSRGYDPDDDAQLAGLEERKFSVEAGVGAAWRGDAVYVEALSTADILGRSDGETYVLSLGFPRRFKDNRLELIPHVDVVRFSESSIDYYYGVRPDEAVLPDRPAYEGEATTNLRFSTRGSFRFDNAWAVSGRFTVNLLGDGITDSPIVDRDLTWTVNLTVLRRIGGDPNKQRHED